PHLAARAGDDGVPGRHDRHDPDRHVPADLQDRRSGQVDRGEDVADGAGAGRARVAAELPRARLVSLMLARLALCVAILGVALVVTARGDGEPAAAGERGLYATVVLAFAASIAFALLHGRVRRLERF